MSRCSFNMHIFNTLIRNWVAVLSVSPVTASSSGMVSGDALWAAPVPIADQPYDNLDPLSLGGIGEAWDAEGFAWDGSNMEELFGIVATGPLSPAVPFADPEPEPAPPGSSVVLPIDIGGDVLGKPWEATGGNGGSSSGKSGLTDRDLAGQQAPVGSSTAIAAAPMYLGRRRVPIVNYAGLDEDGVDDEEYEFDEIESHENYQDVGDRESSRSDEDASRETAVRRRKQSSVSKSPSKRKVPESSSPSESNLRLTALEVLSTLPDVSFESFMKKIEKRRVTATRSKMEMMFKNEMRYTRSSEWIHDLIVENAHLMPNGRSAVAKLITAHSVKHGLSLPRSVPYAVGMWYRFCVAPLLNERAGEKPCSKEVWRESPFYRLSNRQTILMFTHLLDLARMSSPGGAIKVANVGATNVVSAMSASPVSGRIRMGLEAVTTTTTTSTPSLDVTASAASGPRRPAGKGKASKQVRRPSPLQSLPATSGTGPQLTGTRRTPLRAPGTNLRRMRADSPKDGRWDLLLGDDSVEARPPPAQRSRLGSLPDPSNESASNEVITHKRIPDEERTSIALVSEPMVSSVTGQAGEERSEGNGSGELELSPEERRIASELVASKESAAKIMGFVEQMQRARLVAMPPSASGCTPFESAVNPECSSRSS